MLMPSRNRIIDSIITKLKYSSMAILFFILLLSGVAVIFFSKIIGQVPTSAVFFIAAICVEIVGVLVIAVFGYLRLPRTD